MRNYYEAYEERYQTIHALGYAWAGDRPTPIVEEMLTRYKIPKTAPMLELGCGEGRDANHLLGEGYDLLATDISPEAIAWCRKTAPAHADRFRVLDCLRGALPAQFDFIYAVAVLHMLTEDQDRARFFAFLREHLTESGFALICTMGDGEFERKSDPGEAFDLKLRNHPAGPVMVASTTCRMVSFQTLEREVRESGLTLLEKGLTASPPEFDSLMYAVVKNPGF